MNYWNVKNTGKNLEISVANEGKIKEQCDDLCKRKKQLEVEKNRLLSDREKIQNTEDRSKINTRISQVGIEIKQIEREYAQLCKREKVCRLNSNTVFKVQRFKNSITKKENLIISIFENGLEEGRIATTTKNVRDDIYRLEEYGVYLEENYYRRLAEIINHESFELERVYSDYTETEIPYATMVEFVKMCGEQFAIAKQDANDCKLIGITDKFFYVRTTLFNEWFNESVYRRFTSSQIKDALIHYGFSLGNGGRNDCQVNGFGKVIRFLRDSVKKAGWEDES